MPRLLHMFQAGKQGIGTSHLDVNLCHPISISRRRMATARDASKSKVAEHGMIRLGIAEKTLGGQELCRWRHAGLETQNRSCAGNLRAPTGSGLWKAFAAAATNRIDEFTPQRVSSTEAWEKLDAVCGCRMLVS